MTDSSDGSDYSDGSDAIWIPRWKIYDSLRENENSSRRGEIKVRKNEMKLRKKDFEVPMNFLIARWRIPIFYRGICDFLGGVLSMSSKGLVVHRSE